MRSLGQHRVHGWALRSILFAFSSGGRETRGQPELGQYNCPCVGLPPIVPRFNCSVDFAPNDTCVMHPGYHDDLQDVVYQSTYGDTCKKHVEPGHRSCWNLTGGSNEELAAPAGWCNQAWCYVDPSNCDSIDLATSLLWGSGVSSRCEDSRSSTCGSASPVHVVQYC